MFFRTMPAAITTIRFFTASGFISLLITIATRFIFTVLFIFPTRRFISILFFAAAITVTAPVFWMTFYNIVFFISTVSYI